MATGARWNSVRLDQKLSRALEAAGEARILGELDAAVAQVANDTSREIVSSGRGGSHNADMANIEHRVWRARSDRINVNIGWLNPPGHGREKGSGGRLWYQYQDAGFHLFGGDRWIDGVGATLDQRHRTLDAVEDVLRRHVDEVRRALS